MANFVTLAQPFFNSNANAVVATTPISLQGIFINSATPGTITIKDSADGTTGNVVINAWLPPATGWHFMPFRTNNGLTVNVSNTTTYTVSFAG